MRKIQFSNGTIIQNIELIIFDKDGTIFDIHHYWCSMIQLRTKHLLKYFNISISKELEIHSLMGIDNSGQKLKTEGPIGIYPRKKIIEIVFNYIQKQHPLTQYEEVDTIFKDADIESQNYIKDFLNLLPGVQSFINSAHKENIQLAIATTDITSRAIRALEAHNLISKFKYIIGSDDVENSKPAGDLCFKILKELRVDKDNTLVIGDHNVDIEMAINSGIKNAIGVATGLLKREDFNKDTFEIKNNMNEIENVSA